jgi:hypothetical protein
MLCCKQPPSLKSAASEIVFGLVFNLHKFSFDKTNTYSQYVYAAQRGVSIGQLVGGMQFLVLLELTCVQCEDLSFTRLHRDCASVTDGLRGQYNLPIEFQNGMEFIDFVLASKVRYWLRAL